MYFFIFFFGVAIVLFLCFSTVINELKNITNAMRRRCSGNTYEQTSVTTALLYHGTPAGG